MKRKYYSKEFKLEALRLFERGDKTAADLARELGIRRNQLYKWRRELERRGEAEAFLGQGRNAVRDTCCEMTRLRRRVAELEEENAILKKAGAYFAGRRR